MALIRLLQRKANGEIALCEPTNCNVPAYAILSHTWGPEEVVLQDLEAQADLGKTMSKAGWRKIQFCADQAAADGLRYFWIDTCCIDKRNAVELGAAINSMFRWYKNASRCYAYLSDVSTIDNGTNGERAWEDTFRTSRWFTRGWTLQELIAPRLLDFFSVEGKRLGNKSQLESKIHDITRIPSSALQGGALSGFSINERRSWTERRETTIEEDEVYCLLGIFDISMIPNYGEGRKRASRRLEEEIYKLYKGVDHERFAVRLNLRSFPEAVEFVSRETELTRMYELLYGHGSRTAVVLHGLGGIGKTQLSREYIRRHKEKYTAIFWLNANDEDSLGLSFRRIAQQVLKDHPSTEVLVDVDLEGNLDQVVDAVKAWLDLRENSRWLMIYDNYDNPRTPDDSGPSSVDIRLFLPETDHGSVIITTRSASVTQGRRLHIQKMNDLEDGLKILSNMSGRQGVEDDPDAKALVVKLDGLPLALSTAGAYLEHASTSFAEYLQLYEASWSKLQTTSPKMSCYEDRSLYTTWQVTFDRIQEMNAASARLLKWWAYFDKQDVWFGLVRHASTTDDKWIRELTKDELSFNEAIRLLCEYGLAHVEPSLGQPPEFAGYGVHSCVHSWTSSVLNTDWDEGMVQLALTCVASEVPSTDSDKWWVVERRLLQHAARHAKFIVNDCVGVKRVGWELFHLGNLYRHQDKLAEAEVMFTRALQAYEDAYGLGSEETLPMVNNLGLLYFEQGRLVDANAMYTRALEGEEKAFGPNHMSTLRTVDNLGSLYADQGKLVDAEAMYTRALQGCEEVLGPKHKSTLDTVNNLGILYVKQGKMDDAEAMYTRALQGYEEIYGPNHTSVLDAVHGLGHLYVAQGKTDDAETMYTRALQGKEETYGPRHTSTLDTINNLGMLYAGQGRMDDAEAMYTRAIQGYEEIYGPKHSSLLDTVHNIGLLYVEQGRMNDAEAMYTRALQGYEEALGPEFVQSHIPALNTLWGLGTLYVGTKREDLARIMYSRALAGYTTAHGPSSERCKQLEQLLEALRVESVEPEGDQDQPTKIGVPKSKSRSLKHMFHKLGERWKSN